MTHPDSPLGHLTACNYDYAARFRVDVRIGYSGEMLQPPLTLSLLMQDFSGVNGLGLDGGAGESNFLEQ